MMGQKEAVCGIILQTLADRNVEYTGEQPMSEVLTPEDKKSIRELLCEGFIANEIQITESARSKHEADGFKKYVSGLLNNWVRKNPEFNNGIAYEPKNKGSRTGNKDETIKNLRLMLKTITDETAVAEINEAIQARLIELKPELKVEVNADVIPEHLRRFIKA